MDPLRHEWRRGPLRLRACAGTGKVLSSKLHLGVTTHSACQAVGGSSASTQAYWTTRGAQRKLSLVVCCS